MIQTMPYYNYSAIILSAGKSDRMGVPKFSLRFDEKRTFLENSARVFADYGCNEIIIVLNKEGAEYALKMNQDLPSNARIVVNYHPEWEKFHSLKTGAGALMKKSPVFVSNIDNPVINKHVLDRLFEKIELNEYVFPLFGGKGGHPFMISEKVVSDILDEPQEQLHMKDFLNRYQKSGVEVSDDSVLLNLNTPEDYRKIFPLIDPLKKK